jgi:hypothetical protein
LLGERPSAAMASGINNNHTLVVPMGSRGATQKNNKVNWWFG